MNKKWLNIIIFIVLVGATWWAGKGIFKYSVFSTHDLDHHLARAFDAVQSIKEGEFPLRWAGSLNYYCGVPVFNFYYPLLYYLVVLLNLIFNNIIFSFKIIFICSLLLGTGGFYLWAKEETGKIWPALGGAMLYLFGPYRFTLIFVRGSPEYLAYAILPFVLYFYSKAFNSKDLPAGRQGNKFILFSFLASITGALLSISHNFTVMFLTPIILLYLIIKIITNKMDIRRIMILAFSFIGSIAMASFFIGPAVLEQKYTQIGANFLTWQDHFPELWQMWNSKWGYFYSARGTNNDGMSFMLGYAQWLVLAIGAVFVLFKIIKAKFNFKVFLKNNLWILTFFLLTLLSIYLILPWSIPVWEKIAALQQIQFSWRLLGIALFTIASMFVFMLDKIKSKYLVLGLSIGISLFAVFAERNHMLPQPISDKDLYRYEDYDKFHPHRHSTSTLGDEIRPPGTEKVCWFTTPVLSTNKNDKIALGNIDRHNTYGSVNFSIDLKKIKGDKVVMGLDYFPGVHRIFVNGKGPVAYGQCGSQACFDANNLNNGKNTVSWKTGESKIEKLFDYVTIASFIGWVVFIIFKTLRTKNKHE